MVDIDKNELHKINVRPQLAIEADAKEFMQLLLEHKDEIQKKDYTPWINYAKEMKAKYPIVTEEARTQKELVNTYALLDTITEQMTADDIYVSGSSGTCIDVSMQTFRVKRDSVYFVPKVLRQWDLVCLQQLEHVWQVTEEERYASMEMVVFR